MAMNKIFNLGFGHSGSGSLEVALCKINFPTIHHFTPDGTKLRDVIQKNKRLKRNLFYTLDEKFQGFCDFNGDQYYKELYCQYPNSKFILTIRPEEEWVKRMIYFRIQDFPHHYKTKASKAKLTLQFTKRYHNVQLELREFFKDKPNQYLELRICEGEGWEKLCNFLEVEQPDIPFPHEYKTIYKESK